MAKRGPAPQLPAAYDEACRALVKVIKTGKTYTKPDLTAAGDNVTRVKDTNVSFSLERTASRFKIYYMISEGGWLEVTEQSGGDLAEKASRVWDEVCRLYHSGTFSTGQQRRRIPVVTQTTPAVTTAASSSAPTTQRHTEEAVADGVPAAAQGPAERKPVRERQSRTRWWP